MIELRHCLDSFTKISASIHPDQGFDSISGHIIMESSERSYLLLLSRMILVHSGILTVYIDTQSNFSNVRKGRTIWNIIVLAQSFREKHTHFLTCADEDLMTHTWMLLP